MPTKIKVPQGVRYLAGGYVNLKRKQRLTLKSKDSMHNVTKTATGKHLKMAYQEWVQVGSTTFNGEFTIKMEHFKDGAWVECKYKVKKDSDGSIRVWGESGGKVDFNDCLTWFFPVA